MDIKKRLFAAALVVALASLGILMNGARETAKASPGAAPVNIVSPLPLPTTAAQSGAWNVGINGIPNVNIGTPTVNLGAGNTVGINGTVQVTSSSSNPILVKDLNSPALNPFFLNLAFPTATTDQHNFTVTAQTPVPPGQRLVLEDISVFGIVPALNQLNNVCVGAGDNTVCVSPQTGDRSVVNGKFSLYSYNRLVRAYFNAGDVIQAIFAQEEITPTPCCPPPGLVGVNFYLHGHYEAVP